MIAFPHAKINLGLHITARRPDGYHQLQTVFLPVPWCDALEVVVSEEAGTRFIASGLPIPGNTESNLVLRAIDFLRQLHPLPGLDVYLHKAIPMGAGLGGGSSDAAFALRIVNELCALGLKPNQLKGIAAQLGSDCAFFIEDSPMLASGRGEILQAIDMNLEGWHLVVVMPPVSVGTAEAYSWITPAPANVALEQILSQGPESWKGILINDFEIPVCRRHPVIADAIKHLYEAGAVYAAMSGSGAAVFGLFRDATELPAPLRAMRHWSGAL
jgi:4-diphosphocytidyl-2-C-methyl-D-erythritol kinase